MARFVCSAVFGSPPWLRTVLAVSSTPRSAAFTESPVGKAAAISGSSTTILLCCRSLSKYFPRTPPGIEAKSYSLRISSLEWLAFFIKPSFLSGGASSTDDSDHSVIASASVCATTSNSCVADSPMVRKRASPSEWSSLGKVAERGSAKIVAASRKSTPCFSIFVAAFAGSHVISTAQVYASHQAPAILWLTSSSHF